MFYRSSAAWDFGALINASFSPAVYAEVQAVLWEEAFSPAQAVSPVEVF